MFNTSLDFAFVLMIGVGMTFSSKNVVGLNLITECIHCVKWQENALVSYLLIEPILSFTIVFYYNYICINWIYIHIIFTIGGAFAI